MPEGKNLLFIPADADSCCVAAGTSDCILLCPGRFNSKQLAWVATSLAMADRVLLFDPDNGDDLCDAIRKNDTRALGILLARWEVEREAEIKMKLMAETLDHVAVIVEGAL